MVTMCAKTSYLRIASTGQSAATWFDDLSSFIFLVRIYRHGHLQNPNNYTSAACGKPFSKFCWKFWKHSVVSKPLPYIPTVFLVSFNSKFRLVPRSTLFIHSIQKLCAGKKTKPLSSALPTSSCSVHYAVIASPRVHRSLTSMKLAPAITFLTYFGRHRFYSGPVHRFVLLVLHSPFCYCLHWNSSRIVVHSFSHLTPLNVGIKAVPVQA
jgi:hypothetical protein